MEVRQLNTLIRAAQFQSFSKAAESLGYSQSAVTVQIKTLEEELGVRLFDRMGKRVILTAQGRRFLEYAHSVLDTIHSARQAMSDDTDLNGCLHIGTLESLCFFRLPGLMRQFRRENPGVSLRVNSCFSFQGKFFHFLTINRHRKIEYDLLYPTTVFSLFREHLNSLDKGLHKLLLLRFRCGMVDFIKCQ